jgi:CheY-like chemotaxis protein
MSPDRLHVLSQAPSAYDRSPEATPRILVAEDDSEIRRVVTETLRNEGYDVLDAGDSTQLLVWLIQEGARRDSAGGVVDLILTDAYMPKCSRLDVVEVLIEVLKDVRLEVPVIVMSPFCDDQIRECVMQLGAATLPEPLQMDVLMAAVRTSLG